VCAIDDRRTAYVRGLLLEIGYVATEADALARLLVCFVVGETMRGLTADRTHREIYARFLAEPLSEH